ncbi:hypothetical protein AK812_SmicGene20863 [Symbiodinium microadriaticum]|uniref:Uncharacterized protein n=1 Tax=Symbiodinium microadriaticum TaxID=2951 RepID=A0A1Q9DNU5_SYMMI|nr:hypothetical protein AK812_SmicGene20863 [Symbiodinium microadriaticum]
MTASTCFPAVSLQRGHPEGKPVFMLEFAASADATVLKKDNMQEVFDYLDDLEPQQRDKKIDVTNLQRIAQVLGDNISDAPYSTSTRPHRTASHRAPDKTLEAMAQEQGRGDEAMEVVGWDGGAEGQELDTEFQTGDCLEVEFEDDEAPDDDGVDDMGDEEVGVIPESEIYSDEVRVHESHFFPAWESMPHLLKRARVSHRDAGRSRSVKVVPKFSAGVVSIEQWCLLEETDREAVSRATVNLCLQRGLVGQLTSVGSVIGGESAGAEPNLADDDLSDFPVLFVPPWLGQCIFTKQWHDLVMLGRWAHQCPKLEEFLPPQNAGASMPAQPACLTAEAAERCVELLRDAFAKLSISLSDEDQVAGLRLDTLRCIEDLSAHRDSLVPDSAHVRLFDKVTKESSFLRQILASLDLKNRGKLKQHARKFIECIPEGLRPGATAWVQSAFASSSKLCRGRLQLDIAMLLFQRARVQAKGSVLRYMWGDATTKRPWEIYNVRYRMCRSAEVISLARAFKWLCAHPAASEDSAALPEDVQAQRCVYSQLLFDSFELHTQVPQLLGQGRTKLIDKVSAHVQSGLLEAGDLEGLQAYLSSCVAWCSDMGVEAGIPDCEVQCIESVLPPCVRPSRLHICNTEDENFADEGLLTAEPERARESTLMPDAIHVPGTCHAIHNACLNLDTALSDIDWFIASVKKLHPLFSVKRRRDRFLHVALHGTPQYDQGKQILESFSGTLHTERWGELAGYLRTAYPLLLFCRQYWDGVAYARGLDDGGETEEFSCSAITEVLKDDYFLVYWQLQIALRDMIQHLLRWVEGCACHSNLLQGKSAFGQEQALREEIQCPGEVTCQCPLMGCQAAGLVAGHMETFAETFAQTGFNDFMSKNPTALSTEQWGRLASEWHKGGMYFHENLKIRLAYLQALPWVILGGTHSDSELSKGCLRKALRLWDELPEEAKVLQHHKAQHLFKVGPLRADLERYLLPDASLQDCPMLEAFLAPLTFVQVAERIIEGAHKDIGAMPKFHSMTALSITLRAPQLNRCLALQPDAFTMLLEAFARARKIKQFAQHFTGFINHPLLIALKADKASRTTAHFTALRLLLYRDASVQHGDVQAAERWNNVKKQRAQKQKQAFVEKEQLSLELLYGEHATAHVRSVCAADASLVLSVGRNLYAPLVLRPSGIHQPAHAPCTIATMNKNDMLLVRLPNEGTAEAPVVSALSEGEGAEPVNLCGIARSMGVDAFLQNVQLWQKPSQVQLCCPDVTEELPAADVSCLLQKMVDDHAMEGCTFGVIPFAGSREERALEVLVAKGLAIMTGFGGQLTEEGIASLGFRHRLASPRALNQIVPGPLEEMHEFQLLVVMQQSGWTWRRLPVGRKDRASLHYKFGEELLWYTAGVTVKKSYLLCLLNAEKLKNEHAIESIPHALPAEAYDRILTGVPVLAALQDLDKPGSRKRKPPAVSALNDLELDVEGLDDETEPIVLPEPSRSRRRARTEAPHPSAGEAVEHAPSSLPAVSLEDDDETDEILAELEAQLADQEYDLHEPSGPSVEASASASASAGSVADPAPMKRVKTDACWQLVEMQKLTSDPPAVVMTDVELDGLSEDAGGGEGAVVFIVYSILVQGPWKSLRRPSLPFRAGGAALPFAGIPFRLLS